MSHQLNLSTGRGSCRSASFRVAHRQLSSRVFPSFRAYTPRALDTTCTPTFPAFHALRKYGGAGKSRDKLTRHPTTSSTRKIARATRHVYEREGKRIWHNNGRLYLGYTGGVCTLFSMVSAPGPLFRRPSTRKLGGTNERDSFILLITSEFAPIVGIKFVRFVSMNETHCRGISSRRQPPPFEKCESRKV